MNTPLGLSILGRWLLGQSPELRRHVRYVMLTLLPYAVSVGVIVHSVYLGLLERHMAEALSAASALSFLLFYVLVRSGWTQRFADPVLTFVHAMVCISLCLAAYAVLGAHRANTVILIAQTIVLSMFRLRPIQVLLLGVYTVAILAGSIAFLCLNDPVQYPPSSGWAHFVVAGSTLLVLSLIGKWVSDIRVRIGRQARELAEAIDTVQHMATTDMLTGALNRRMMTDLAELELKLSERTGSPMCVALIDIDHFKHVNDHFGHHVGDAVLKDVTRQAQTQLRQVDKFGRWGGEEFLLMLPRVSLQECMAALERLRQSVEAMKFDGHPNLRVTFSAGLAQAHVGDTLEHLVERADQALYAAKRQGRNRCLLAANSSAPRQGGAPGTQLAPAQEAS
jgi:diguanylate cyclase (GGDEF)-like protein